MKQTNEKETHAQAPRSNGNNIADTDEMKNVPHSCISVC